MATKPTFVYTPRDATAVAKRANQQGGMYDNVTKDGILTYKAAQGENVIRILPCTWTGGDGHYGFDVHMHGNIGADRNQYICREKMGKGPCPICDYRRQLEKSDGADSDELKSLASTRRVAIWLIDRATEKEGPKLWLMGWTLDKELATLSMDKRNGHVLHIDDPDNGYDVIFTREGTNKKTRYLGVKVDREKSSIAIKDDRYNSVLDFIQDNPIPDVLQYYDPEHIAAVLNGKAAPEEGEEPAPARPRSRLRDQAEPEEPPPRRRAAAAEPEEEAPPPRRRGAPVETEEEIEDGRRRAAVEPAARARQSIQTGGDREEEEPPPPRRRAAPVEAEDDPLPPRRRATPVAAEEEAEAQDEALPPRRRAMQDEPPPRRRAAAAEPEEEAPPPRRRAAAAAVEEEEAPAAAARGRLRRLAED